MNKRQRKKRAKMQELTLVIRSQGVYKAAEYELMRKSIEYQLACGNVVILPSYLHVEAVIQARGHRRIEIRGESEAGNELQTVEKEVQKDSRAQPAE